MKIRNISFKKKLSCKIFSFVFFLLIILSTSTFASNYDFNLDGSKFEILNLGLKKQNETDDNSNLNLEIIYKLQNLEDKTKYSVDFLIVNKKTKDVIENNCLNEFVYDSNVILSKRFCLVENVTSGDYEIFSKIKNIESGELIELYNLKNILDDKISLDVDFKIHDNKTTITLNINDEFLEKNLNLKKQNKLDENSIENLEKYSKYNLTVYSRIPKEVIEILNEENKNDLLISNYNYTIIEEDPLIAWNIERPPKKINYTVNKEISVEEQKKFEFNIQKNDTSDIKYLEYIIWICIIIVIILIIMPIIKNKNKKENKNINNNLKK